MKLDPKSIGVGQYQHDVDQHELKVGLDDTVDRYVDGVPNGDRITIRQLADIGILGADETAALVPASGAAATRARVWPEILAEAVASNPDAPALSSRERSMTYRELDEESTKLARALCRRGVGPEDFVALGLPRSTAEIVAIWAVTKTGAAFLPVDPNYPDDRINHMLDDSRAVLGITDDAHRSQLPDTVEWMVLDEAETVDEINTGHAKEYDGVTKDAAAARSWWAERFQ